MNIAHLFATSLFLLAGLMPATAAASCEALSDERCGYPSPDAVRAGGGGLDCTPYEAGAPSGGSPTERAEWYRQSAARSACTFGTAAQDLVLEHGGDLAWTAGKAEGGLVRLLPGGDADQRAIQSEAHDACFVLVGAAFCGEDTAVNQTQRCPNGLALPQNPHGGLLGDALGNGNAALQATCVISPSLPPNPVGEATAIGASFLHDLIGAAVEAVQDAYDLRLATYQFSSNLWDSTCIFLTGTTPCV